MKTDCLIPEFVDFIPDAAETGKLYIAATSKTALHKCCCGCGRDVVTPLTPTDWKLDFDGKSVSLFPSVGNWSFPCRSQYWISNGRVLWAEQWSLQRVAAARALDQERKEAYYRDQHTLAPRAATALPTGGFWSWLWKAMIG